MERIDFLIQGSAAEPYAVAFTRAGGSVVAICSCPAGGNGQICKHRIGILRGESEICRSLPSEDVAAVQGWLAGTSLEEAMDNLTAAEMQAAAAQALLKSAKKRLAAALHGRG